MAKLYLFLLVALVFTHRSLSSDPPQSSPSPAPQLPADDSPSPAPHLSSPPSPPLPPDLAPESSPAPAPVVTKSNSSTSPAPEPVPSDTNREKANAANVDGEGEKDDGTGGLSGGKKAGIAIGVIACAVVVGVGGILYKKRQQNIQRSQFGYAARREIL